MTHFYKSSLALAFLITSTCSITASYKEMLIAASATVAAGITTNYLYNYVCKQADNQAGNNGARLNREAQNISQTILSAYAYELNILAQHTGYTQNPAVFNQLYAKIGSLYATKSCYHYAVKIESNLATLHAYLQGCQRIKADLATRTQSVTTSNRHSCQEQELLIAQYVNVTADMNALEIVLQKHINDLSTIRWHVISSKQYALEYQQVRIEQLERYNKFSTYYYYQPYYSRPYVNVTYQTTIPAPKTTTATTYTVTITPQTTPITFDKNVWCDRMDPFNS